MFAYKPSPVQVNWLGYFNTTGLKAIDWIIADKNVLPAKDKRYFTEKPYYMPDIYYAYSKPTVDTNTLESPFLKNGYITFGCFNNYCKLNEKVLDSWAKILAALPEAKLILKNRQLANQYLSKSLLKKFSKRGIEVSRIILESSSPMKAYYNSFNKIDIALDPFPFPGGTTTIDGLWMGVPVVTLSGNTFVSRQGETIIKNIGMDNWISYTEDEYVNLAIKKAKSLSKILKTNGLYKQKLRMQVENSTVMNTKLFSSHLADAFRGMWIDYLKNKKA
jgi:predicted O-linked N-acetylglucosamine transferase (SPINDLY family)